MSSVNICLPLFLPDNAEIFLPNKYKPLYAVIFLLFIPLHLKLNNNNSKRS